MKLSFVFLFYFSFLFWKFTLANRFCDNLAPGFARMTLGVDLTCVDFEPFDMSEPDGFRTPVIEFTCDKGKTWRNPFNNITYQMPDQVWSIVNKPGSFKEVETEVYENIIDIKTEKTIKVKVKKFWGLFSARAS